MTLNWKVLLFMDARDIFKLPQLNATKYECRRKYKKRREKHFETNWKISSIVFRWNGKKPTLIALKQVENRLCA